MDDSDQTPIIERSCTYIGATMGFVCGLMVAAALIKNGNKDETIIFIGFIAPLLFFRWIGQSVGQKIQSLLSGSKNEIISQISDPAIPPPLEAYRNEQETACPACGGIVREWNDELRCWECGYTGEASIPLPFPEPQKPIEVFDPEPVGSSEESTYTLTLNTPGPNYYRIKKIIAEIRPDLSTFEIYEMLKQAPQTVAEHVPAATAQLFQQKLEAAECQIQLR